MSFKHPSIQTPSEIAFFRGKREWKVAVNASALKPSVKVVAQVLLDMTSMDKDKPCRPTAAHIVGKCGQSIKTVRRAIDELVAHGWIVKITRVGRGLACEYFLHGADLGADYRTRMTTAISGGQGTPKTGRKSGQAEGEKWSSETPKRGHLCPPNKETKKNIYTQAHARTRLDCPRLGIVYLRTPDDYRFRQWQEWRCKRGYADFATLGLEKKRRWTMGMRPSIVAPAL